MPFKWGPLALPYVLVTGVLVLTAVVWDPVAGEKPTQAGIWVNSGYRLVETSRTGTVDLCDEKRAGGSNAGAAQECIDAGVDPAKVNPTITSFALASDLDEGNRSCKSEGGAQFPASQLTVTVANGGPGQLIVGVTANPDAAEQVPPGTYCGEVLVNRTSSDSKVLDPPITVPIAVSVGDRYQVPILLRVLLSLLLGAGLGFLLKWFADNLEGLSKASRTYERALEIGGPTLTLPTALRHDVIELKRLIDRGEAQAAAEKTALLSSLVEYPGRLREWKRVMDALTDAIVQLEPPMQFPDGLQSDAQSRLSEFTELRAARWADDAIDLATDEPESDSGSRAESLAAAIRAWKADEIADSQLATVLARGPSAAMTATEESPSANGARRSVIYWLASHRTMIAGLLGVAAAVIVGLVQFASDGQFNNQPRWYLELFGLAVAAQLAGVTLVQLAGRLSPPPPTPTP